MFQQRYKGFDKMKLIVAVCENWGIGKDGSQPFFIPEDLRFFKDKTIDKVVVMGRVTFLALPQAPLPYRINVVLTRDTAFASDDIIVCNSLEDLEKFVADYDTDDVFIIGGQQIYEAMLGQCDTAYVTKIFAAAPTDRFFPNLDAMDDWRLHNKSETKVHDGIKFCFCEYKNDAHSK